MLEHKGCHTKFKLVRVVQTLFGLYSVCLSMFQNITAPTLFPIFLACYKYIYKYINDEKCPSCLLDIFIKCHMFLLSPIF